MLTKKYVKMKCSKAKAFDKKMILPKDNHQLDMAIGVVPKLYLEAKENVLPHLLRMG